jgi:hypothetical protein
MNYRIDAYLTENRVKDASQTFIMSLSNYVTGLSFTTSIQGGYMTAVIDLVMKDAAAWDLLLVKGLGTRLVLVNPHATNTDMIAWEGTVYTITIDDGKNLVNRSLANEYNQVRVTYSIITFDGGGLPIFGAQATTADAASTGHQAIYGIRELNYIAGSLTAADATALRDTLLLEYKKPLATPQSARRGGGGDPSDIRVTLECAGIWETLDKRFYGHVSTGGTTYMNLLLGAALTSVAQFANSDQSNLTSNTMVHTQYSTTMVTAQAYINGICALGGPNNRRFYFQFLDHGIPYYFEEPTTVAYRARRLDPSEAIYDAVTGAVVPPWLVLPGRIIRIDDLMPDAASYTTTLDDPRAFLIGDVNFTAPALVELIPAVKDPSQLSLARFASSPESNKGAW